MTARGFLDLQTPILSATSPEGARDFLVDRPGDDGGRISWF
jgi:aspartyl-tRNA synthetase